MQMWNSPPAVPSSMLNVVTTTTSLGVAMFANCVFISERMYSNFSGEHRRPRLLEILEHDTEQALDDALLGLTVKSRPSTRVWNSPLPPNRLSITRYTRSGSKMKSAVPRSGFACTRFRLVGTTRLRTNSLYFCDAHRSDRDFRGAAHEVEESDAQQSRETLVDDLERRHPPANDAFLRREVVRPYATRISGLRAPPRPPRSRRRGAHRLRPARGSPCSSHYWMMKPVKSTSN